MDIHTSKHCTYPMCGYAESENYSELIKNISESWLRNSITEYTDDTGLHYTDDSYLCHSHIRHFELVLQGSSMQLFTRSQKFQLLNVSSSAANSSNNCVSCRAKDATTENVPANPVKTTQLQHIRNPKLRSYISRKHISVKKFRKMMKSVVAVLENLNIGFIINILHP